MKILVSGARGFIGRNLISVLKKAGHHVFTLKAFHADVGCLENQIHHLNDEFQLLQNSFCDIDVFVHLAWMDTNNWNSDAHLNINEPLSRYLIEYLAFRDVRHIIVVGTCLEYGGEGELNESMEALPNNNYALAKYELYKNLRRIARKKNFTLTWLRLFYVYGGDQPPNTLFGSLKQHITQEASFFDMSLGQQIRDYLHIDLVSQRLAAVILSKKEFDVLNLCSGEGRALESHVRSWITQIDIDNKIELKLGTLPYRDDEPFALWGSSEKFEQLVNL
ncbi:NAD(P)-dependent oxidoreductase [Porticoccaceae bacterium]|nr:NAD(P)-dependent oxidoreductase [Porticoccaceae bacterium]